MNYNLHVVSKGKHFLKYIINMLKRSTSPSRLNTRKTNTNSLLKTLENASRWNSLHIQKLLLSTYFTNKKVCKTKYVKIRIFIKIKYVKTFSTSTTLSCFVVSRMSTNGRQPWHSQYRSKETTALRTFEKAAYQKLWKQACDFQGEG